MNTRISVASASGMSELEKQTLFPDSFKIGIKPYIMDKRWAVAADFALLSGQRFKHHVLQPDSLIEVAVLDLETETQSEMEKFVAAFDAFEDKYHLQKEQRTFYVIGEKPSKAITPVKAEIYFLNKAEDLAGMDGTLNSAPNYGNTKTIRLDYGNDPRQKEISVVWRQQKEGWKLTLVVAPEKQFPLTHQDAKAGVFNFTYSDKFFYETQILQRLVYSLR